MCLQPKSTAPGIAELGAALVKVFVYRILDQVSLQYCET